MIKKPMPTAWLMRRNSRLSARKCQRNRREGKKQKEGRTLAASGKELSAILDELLWHVEELLCLVHVGRGAVFSGGE